MTNLHYVLKRMSLSGRQLAEMSGLSLSSIYKYLSGNRELSLRVARAKLEPVLGVPAEQLVGRYEPQEQGRKA